MINNKADPEFHVEDDNGVIWAWRFERVRTRGGHVGFGYQMLQRDRSCTEYYIWTTVADLQGNRDIIKYLLVVYMIEKKRFVSNYLLKTRYLCSGQF